MNLDRITLVTAYIAYRNNTRKCHITHLSSSSDFMHRLTREEYQYQLPYRLLMHTGSRNGEGRDHIFFTLMKRLGHSSINTTINVYSHLFPTQKKKLLMPLIIFNNKAN